MKLTRLEQLNLSRSLAEFIGWRNVRRLHEDVIGERRGLRLLVPNYFDRDSHSAKAELIAYVAVASMHDQTIFLSTLLRHSSGAGFSTLDEGDKSLTVRMLIDLLNAPPGLVARAFVETYNLEEVALGVAA